jgi:hypothetical protein
MEYVDFFLKVCSWRPNTNNDFNRFKPGEQDSYSGEHSVATVPSHRHGPALGWTVSTRINAQPALKSMLCKKEKIVLRYFLRSGLVQKLTELGVEGTLNK